MGKGGKGKSNEDAMWAMMESKGTGKGRSGGRGGGKGGKGGKGDRGPPSSDELSEAQRSELRKSLEDFRESSDTQKSMPTSVNGLERKYLHEVAQEMGFTSQSFGQGRDRYLCIFKPEAPTGDAGRSSEPVVTGPASVEIEDTGSGSVAYSALVLDEESQQRLRVYAEKAGQIGSDWTYHGEHMTICMGALKAPLTEDNRSVAGALHEQIADYKVGQEFDVKVVSEGSLGNVFAVGVVGCASCNRNPHITVAVAPRTRPHVSNNIKQWSMLPTDKQFALHGMVWQRGGTRAQEPAAWVWSKSRAACKAAGGATNASVEQLALATASGLVRAYLRSLSGGRPRSEAALRAVLKKLRILQKKMWIVHPASLAESLKSSMPPGIVEEIAGRLEAPTPDPLGLFLRKEAAPEQTVNIAKARIRHLLDPSPRQLALWVATQASATLGSIHGVDADSLIASLAKDGVLKIGPSDRMVEYLNLGDTSAPCTYMRPWPMKPPPKSEEEKLDDEIKSAKKLLSDALKAQERRRGRGSETEVNDARAALKQLLKEAGREGEATD